MYAVWFGSIPVRSSTNKSPLGNAPSEKRKFLTSRGSLTRTRSRVVQSQSQLRGVSCEPVVHKGAVARGWMVIAVGKAEVAAI